ncbi:hypothetical protein Ddye_003707 [Dipteronia dyeriana]|uniref:Uncharacterized protein n=1 Tax=Dipteronia dyeriana TaxID=168575 RepID=A0AAD9XTH6_9ROSI|nr:hypothetical protein Ddye_003707 [Dipteronia dyeriana]
MTSFNDDDNEDSDQTEATTTNKNPTGVDDDGDKSHYFDYPIPNDPKVYKDDRIERYTSVITVDPRHDPSMGVQSKDVMISSETSVKARIFIQKIDGPD